MRDAEAEGLQRLFVFNGGFLTQPGLRRILKLAGYRVTIGMPNANDSVGVWGQSPYAHRGERIAQIRGAKLVRIEDAFLRSLHPGRAGEPPIGLQIDHSGVHFDGRHPSDLETLLATHPLDDSALMARARACIDWMKEAHLSKYTAFDPSLSPPAPGYVLVVDQTFGDASVRASQADRARFIEMLVMAQEENPGARIVIKTHPETRAGFRAGHYTDADLNNRISFCDTAVSPWSLLDGAVGVYTVSSQLGFEAILAGHKPRVFGQPIYSGWGLTQDEMPVPRRERRLTRAQLFAGMMMLFPVWYDPYRDQLTQLEDVLGGLEAQSRAWREDHKGWIASGMRLWKRKPLQSFFGAHRKISFEDQPDAAKARNEGRRQMVWANKATSDAQVRVEDGFLRSRGLGAQLIPPLSLVCDDLGIYYDPRQTSRLEQLILQSPRLRPDQLQRAARLRQKLVTDNLSKYNLGGKVPDLPIGHRILVPGQVEDDASILSGSPTVSTNAALLERTRSENPDAVILYKPHPDVETGLRKGNIADPEKWADCVIRDADMGQLLTQVNEVWTMTSLTGFEALLRGLPVTTVGLPFYAGWGLTADKENLARRQGHHIALDGLVYATLIQYPRYFDPVSGLPCTAELIAERLAKGQIPLPGPFNRTLSKLQGLMASYAHLWRS